MLLATMTTLAVYVMLLSILRNGNGDDVVICKPTNFKKMWDFLLINWENARQELDITESSSEESLLSIPNSFNTSYITKFANLSDTQKHDYLNRFYSYTSGNVIFCPENTIISYARIYKCANEAIMLNLKTILLQGIGARRYHTDMLLHNYDKQVWFRSKIRESPIDDFTSFHFKLNLTADFRSKQTDFKTFTFIRNPMDHFESAMR